MREYIERSYEDQSAGRMENFFGNGGSPTLDEYDVSAMARHPGLQSSSDRFAIGRDQTIFSYWQNQVLELSKGPKTFESQYGNLVDQVNTLRHIASGTASMKGYGG